MGTGTRQSTGEGLTSFSDRTGLLECIGNSSGTERRVVATIDFRFTLWTAQDSLAASEAAERAAAQRLKEMKADMEALAARGQGVQRTAARVAEVEQQLQVGRAEGFIFLYLHMFRSKKVSEASKELC